MAYDATDVSVILSASVTILIAIAYIFRKCFHIRFLCCEFQQVVTNTDQNVNTMISDFNEMKNNIPQTNRMKSKSNFNIQLSKKDVKPVKDNINEPKNEDSILNNENGLKQDLEA
jgi:hypothetical protein